MVHVYLVQILYTYVQDRLKANIFISITCNFSSIHDIDLAWFSIRNSATCEFQKLFQVCPLLKIIICYVLRTVYNSVIDMIILLGKAVSNVPFAAYTDFVAFRHKIRQYAILAIFGYILYNVFCEG